MTFSSEGKKNYPETVRVMQRKSEQNFAKRLNDSEKNRRIYTIKSCNIPKWFSAEGVMPQKTFFYLYHNSRKEDLKRVKI